MKCDSAYVRQIAVGLLALTLSLPAIALSQDFPTQSKFSAGGLVPVVSEAQRMVFTGPDPPDLAEGYRGADPSPITLVREPSEAVTGESFRMNQTSATPLANDFTAVPDFDGALIVVGTDAALKIGGYIKADLIHDYDAIDSTDSFVSTTIPTSGPGRQNTRFHARQSRLSFDTRWRTNGDVVRAFVEADFFGGERGGSDNFRLRHAFGRLGNFTAGQTWTTFTDPAAIPQTLDFEGAVSNVNRRQGLVRWDQPLWFDGLSVAFGIEDPRILIEAPTLVVGEARTESPDFIMRLRSEHQWVQLQSAFVVRKLGFQPAGEPVIDGTAWGLNFTGVGSLGERTRAYSQVNLGEGIGSFRGSPDVVATGPDTAEILPVFGWMVGVHHQWNDRLTSNFTYSELSLENLPGQNPKNLRETSYLAANVIVNPYERVFCGVEYLYGTREDVSGARGEAHRIQMSFGFFLP